MFRPVIFGKRVHYHWLTPLLFYWTEILARSAASVTATDINEEVLAIARAKSLDPKKVALRREDAYSLPRLPQKFTGGFSGFWWSHIPKAKIQEFLWAFHRLLSPGAKVVFMDNNYVEGSSTPISRTDEHGDTYQMRRLDDGSTHEVLKNFPTRSELHAVVNGLAADVRVELLHYYWILSYVVWGVAMTAPLQEELPLRLAGLLRHCLELQTHGSLGAMSYISSYYRCVFSTKGRQPCLSPAVRERLWPFPGGIAREHHMKALAIGGIPDHVHLLVSLPSTFLHLWDWGRFNRSFGTGWFFWDPVPNVETLGYCQNVPPGQGPSEFNADSG